MGELSHTDAAGFLGVYALDALDTEEREAVERHLRECRACQSEVAQHREVAAVLAPGWSRAPEGLWDRISDSLEETPPPLELPLRRPEAQDGGRPPAEQGVAPVVPIDSRRRRSRTLGVAAAMVAAVAAVAIIAVLGVRVADDGRRIDQMAEQVPATELDRTITAALRDPAARQVDLRSADGVKTASVVLLPDGTGYLADNTLPALDPGHTYQLWAVMGANKISVGVLGSRPGRAAFKAAGDPSALAVTDEVAGGVVTTNRNPVVFGAV